MNYWKMPVVALLSCAAAFVASAQETQPAPEPAEDSALRRTLPEAPKAVTPPPDATPKGPSAEEIEAAVAQATLRRAISQLMFVTLEGTSLFTSTDRLLLERYPPGGMIIRTVSRPTFAVDYIETLRTYAKDKTGGVPPFVGTDLFALPRRDRLQKDKFVQTPSLLAIAAADHPESTRRFSEFLATQLTVLGFNMHVGPSLSLAPVLKEAEGTIACLGSNPDFAARAAESIVGVMDDEGIVTMPADFPGGGFNRIDGRGGAVLLTPQNVIHQADLLPYQQAIDAGAPMMHVGTTTAPTLDPVGVPSCISPVVMQDVLRKDMGFDGVIVAGPMDSPEIEHTMDVSEAAILALVSGADMLLWNTSGTRVMRTVDAIVEAVESGRLEQEVIEEAAARIAKVKEGYKLSERPMPKKSEARAWENKRKYPREAYELERRSITLLLNRGRVLPLTEEKSLPVLVTGVAGVTELHEILAEDHFRKKPVMIQPIVTAKHAGRIHDFEVDRVTKNAVGLRTAVCVFTPEEGIAGQLEIVRKLKARGAKVVVVLLGYPSTVPKFHEADAVLLAYSDPRYTKETMKAVADVLVGLAPLRILAPVRDLETRAGKPETYSAYDVVQTPVGRFPISLQPPYLTGLSVPYSVEDTLKKAEWDFGDGDRKKGFKVERAYKEPGRYPITLTVTDRNGEETSGTFYATVTP